MINLRNVSAADLDLVCRHREEMFREAGSPEADLAAMSAPFRSWLAPRLTDGRYFGFIAESDRMPIGGIGLMEIDWPPHPFHPTAGRRGLLMESSDREFERRGLTFLVLHATAAGRPLYERVGWAQTSEMSKSLPSVG
jgi:RimJ/RimL family protein N-acetyltransferase